MVYGLTVKDSVGAQFLTGMGKSSVKSVCPGPVSALPAPSMCHPQRARRFSQVGIIMSSVRSSDYYMDLFALCSCAIIRCASQGKHLFIPTSDYRHLVSPILPLLSAGIPVI